MARRSSATYAAGRSVVEGRRTRRYVIRSFSMPTYLRDELDRIVILLREAGYHKANRSWLVQTLIDDMEKHPLTMNDYLATGRELARCGYGMKQAAAS